MSRRDCRATCLLAGVGLLVTVQDAAWANRKGDTASGLGVGMLGVALLSNRGT